jgi:hypothetical protein
VASYVVVTRRVCSDDRRSLAGIETAERVLLQKTGVKSPYLRQWQAVGLEGRDARFWSVTVMFYALIRYVEVNESEGVRWFEVDGEHNIPVISR